jgi:hypothetical protein
MTEPPSLEITTEMLKDLLWMARRYADGRMSYASGSYNRIAKWAHSQGIEPDYSDGTPFARDGMGRAYDELSEGEASEDRATPEACAHDDACEILCWAEMLMQHSEPRPGDIAEYNAACAMLRRNVCRARGINPWTGEPYEGGDK